MDPMAALLLTSAQVEYLRNLLEQQMDDIADEILEELPEAPDAT